MCVKIKQKTKLALLFNNMKMKSISENSCSISY